MKRLFKVLSVCSYAVILSSCSFKPDSGIEQQAVEPLKPLSCIAVLPARAVVDQDDTVHYEEAWSLERGANYATDVMRRELADTPNVLVLDYAQVRAVIPKEQDDVVGMVLLLGKKLNCAGVLLTTVRRFKQRNGAGNTTKSPAAVTLNMVLRDTDSGAVLWYADFRKPKWSFFKSIFSLGRVQYDDSRRMNVAQLLQHGIRMCFANCPYFIAMQK